MVSFGRALAALLLLVVCGIAHGAAWSDTLPQIWLAPVDPVLRPFNGVKGPPDYPDLFSPDAPWITVASHVKVFKLYSSYALFAPEADLARILADLKRRGIALAVESGVLVATEACGREVEGYNGVALVPLAKRIKRLGGELRFVAMDEPLWYGAHYNQRNACHATPDAVARQAAATLRALREVSPAVEVGDIEPFPLAEPPDWQDEILRWTQAFQGATGHSLAFFHADVLHNTGVWAEPTQALGRALRQQGIAFGVIYNGGLADLSDAAWAAHAREEYETFEAAGDPPDQAIFQSWMNFPTRVLPESAPDTLTGIIRGYLRIPTRIEAVRRGTLVKLRLIDAVGAPIAGAILDTEVTETAGPEVPVAISGSVPATARSALFALRVNTECGGCSGEGGVSLGAGRYQESGGNALAQTVQGWTTSGRARHLSLRLGQPEVLNSAPFAVTPGTRFEARFAVRVDPGLEGGGYLAIIFRDAADKEFVRSELPLRRTWYAGARLRTDSVGRAALDQAGQAASTSLRIRFSGDKRYRPTETTLSRKPE